MRFNRKARLDTSRIGTSSGRGGVGGGLGGVLGRGGAGAGGSGAAMKTGGGIMGLIITAVVIYLLTQVGNGGGLAGGGLDASRMGGTSLSGSGFDYATCQTGEDANASEECALVAVENSLTGYWTDQADLSSGFTAPQAVQFFSGQVQTGGCGAASSAVGPFYCPADQVIYLDPTFFDTIYTQLGGQDSVFVRTYVLAHEYGHHIQNLLGTMGQVRTQQGPESDAVRLELQADCYAGMWTGAAEGDGFIEDLTDQDIREGIDAATVVGDDQIQQRSSGRVDVSQFTHGSSEQRVAWFRHGMTTPDSIGSCDTFAAPDLARP